MAATVIAGAAVGGVVSGFANENAGGSYINGWAGGAVSGGLQAGAGWFGGSLGTTLGGAANGLGFWITDKLDNKDPYNNKYKTEKEIKNDAIDNAIMGVVFSIPGGIMQWMTDFANAGSTAKSLMGYTKGFGEMLNQFYGVIDNMLLAGWNSKSEECL